MSYVTQDDLVPGLLDETALVQLTNDAGGATVDTDTLDAVIADAEGEVDGYLGSRYALPLVSVPQVVTSVTARIVRYKLHARRPGSLSEDLREDYKGAVRLLEQLASGKVTLGLQPEPAQNTERKVRSTSRAPVFGRGNLEGF